MIMMVMKCFFSTVDGGDARRTGALFICANEAIRALCSLIKQRDKIPTGSVDMDDQEAPSPICPHTSNDKAFADRLARLISVASSFSPDKSCHNLTASLTSLFFILTPTHTPVTVATLARLHLLPPPQQEESADFRVEPTPLGFRLLAAYLLSESSRASKSSGTVDVYCTSLVGTAFTDLSPQMAQLVSLLSASLTGLTAKKAFLQALLNSLVLGQPPQRRALRLLALLRYQLHYFFDPPLHLNAQIRPSIVGGEETAAPAAIFWEFKNLVGAGGGCYYDLLFDPASSGSTSYPAEDGLAVMTIVTRSDYDSVLASLWALFDRLVIDSPDLRDASYATQLSARLLEVLPPSSDFANSLFLRLTRGEERTSSSSSATAATGTKRKPSTVVDSMVSRHRLLYLVVVLDRLGSPGAPTSAPDVHKYGNRQVDTLAVGRFHPVTFLLTPLAYSVSTESPSGVLFICLL